MGFCPYGALLDPCTIGARKSISLTRVAPLRGTAHGSHGGRTAAETASGSPRCICAGRAPPFPQRLSSGRRPGRVFGPSGVVSVKHPRHRARQRPSAHAEGGTPLGLIRRVPQHSYSAKPRTRTRAHSRRRLHRTHSGQSRICRLAVYRVHKYRLLSQANSLCTRIAYPNG